jgi:hypothetical protein
MSQGRRIKGSRKDSLQHGKSIEQVYGEVKKPLFCCSNLTFSIDKAIKPKV